MKSITTLLLLVLVLSAAGQSRKIQGKGYRGFAFDSIQRLRTFNDPGRFNLSDQDIELAEKILKHDLPLLNKNKANQEVVGCPDIEKRLRRFYRQYYGYKNREGQRIIWINFFWHKRDLEEAASQIIYVMDGGSYYWQVSINLDKGSAFGLSINGNG